MAAPEGATYRNYRPWLSLCRRPRKFIDVFQWRELRRVFIQPRPRTVMSAHASAPCVHLSCVRLSRRSTRAEELDGYFELVVRIRPSPKVRGRSRHSFNQSQVGGGDQLRPHVQCKIISPFLFSVWADEADASHRVAGRFARPFRRLQDRTIPG